MNKRLLQGIVAGVVVIVALFMVAFVYLQWYRGNLSVIYLANGDLYVGKLTTFPRLVLHEGYQYQTAPDPKDPSKSISRLVPMSEASWAPVQVSLNKSQVIFYGTLLESSDIYKAIKDKESAAE